MPGQATVFASDFHLSSADPGGIEIFVRFLEQRVRGARAFFALGDLFNLWIGPAQLDEPSLQPAFDALKALVAGGTQVTLLHGNRDFLLGHREAAAWGVSIPGESLEASMHGMHIFLTHGDLFCTADRAYQRMKTILRSRIVRGLVRMLPPGGVRHLAEGLRKQSRQAVQRKQRNETDIDPLAVDRLAGARGVDAVLCGHVHRAHETRLDGGARLFVLSEWYQGRGVYAVARDGTIELRSFPD